LLVAILITTTGEATSEEDSMEKKLKQNHVSATINIMNKGSAMNTTTYTW
jgi:hypothetical protein